MPYYAVKEGKVPGIYNTWSECKEQVDGFSKPVYRKFNNLIEANEFISSNEKNKSSKIEKAIKIKKSNDEVYYSVHKGKNIGIFTNWNDCKNQIHGFKGAKYKKFTDRPSAEFYLVNGYEDGSENESVEMEIDPDAVKVYTDGSLVRLEGFIGCGYGIYIPKYHLKQGSILFENKTNNRAELLAIIDAIHLLKEKGEKSITIYTDSSYSILIFGKTGDKYEKKGYKNTKNKDLVMKAQHIKTLDLRIVFRHVKAHTGNLENEVNYGNDIADRIANRNAVLDYTNQDKNWKSREMSIGKFECPLNQINMDYLKTYISTESYISLCKRDESFRTKSHLIEIYTSSI